MSLARLCLIIPFAYIIIYVGGAFLIPESLGLAWVWLQRGVVSAALVCLFVLFLRHSRGSRRPAGLTHAMGISFLLVLPAIITSYWVGVVGALVTPILVACSAIWERTRRVGNH
ncbi:hypothetical protein QWL27_12675 [Streptomyces thermocarboxydus]|uniref:Uncharacterized protein n=1 Tax=Streptomyces cellulosae TaxID=1968 RepID=A0ABW6JAS2_STRCE|nr:hypothetical protein [Streptomyces sp. AC04842]MDN3286623.1 hypothetical protein [Streptomyces thermocarboxydus]GHE62322.1 hypothetical protein GCM10018771_50120 [Streptomyces cellulosae]